MKKGRLPKMFKFIVCARCVHGVVYLRERRYWTSEKSKAKRFKTEKGADRALRHSVRMFKRLLAEFCVEKVPE
jgi:hypothetical protein